VHSQPFGYKIRGASGQYEFNLQLVLLLLLLLLSEHLYSALSLQNLSSFTKSLSFSQVSFWGHEIWGWEKFGDLDWLQQTKIESMYCVLYLTMW